MAAYFSSAESTHLPGGRHEGSGPRRKTTREVRAQVRGGGRGEAGAREGTGANETDENIR